MSSIILERTFSRALTAKFVTKQATDSANCFDLHRVAWKKSFLSLDGHRMCCLFDSPDAESVRLSLRMAGTDIIIPVPPTEYADLWPATTIEPYPLDLPPNVVVQRQFEKSVQPQDIETQERMHIQYLKQHDVTNRYRFCSQDGKRMICLYHAPDVESVRLTQRQAQLSFTHIWSFVEVHPAP